MIKKYAFAIVNSIIIIFIIGAYFFIQVGELSFYKEMAYNQARNDAKLTAGEINGQLSSFASEQILVANMISNDLFIRDWCHNEDGEITGEHAYKLYTYLMEYRLTYGYDCISLVSASSLKYYYDKGYFKTLSPDDEIDAWYYSFLECLKSQDVQVDTDMLNADKISLFVNCLVQDKGFKTLGVVSVSRSIEGFQKKITDLENEYDVTICAVNLGVNYSLFKDSFGFYMKPEEAAEYMGITEDQVTQKVRAGESYTWFDGDTCYNVIYNAELGWNIIVKKDISGTIDAIMDRVNQRTGVMFVLVGIYTLMSFVLLARLNSFSRKAENIDDLTGLYNNKIFKEIFEKSRRRKFAGKEVSLMMIDVDDFKTFNDTYGHLYGNSILKLVAEVLSDCVGKEGIVARWGGDEFIGIVYASPMETKLLTQYILSELKKAETHKTVTCSCGIVKVDNHINLENNMHKADEALYESKTNGKGCSTIYEEK